MNFPQFWAKAVIGDFVCWRWSSNSFAEAQTQAMQAVQQLANRIRNRDYPPKHWGYYPDRPMREQVMEEHKDNAGGVSAVVTRNSYGCLVLNTARVMFVDIDLPEPRPPGLFQRLFGKKGPPPLTDHSAALAKVENWTRQRSDWGWRVYRTRAGLRLLATQGLVEADSKEATDIFEALGTDPLYQKLCKSQKCFRARLTPKPWRCGIHAKPDRWPWLEPKHEKRFERWEAQYRSLTAHWTTCDFIRHIGYPTVHPEVSAVIKYHNAATRVGSKLNLA